MSPQHGRPMGVADAPASAASAGDRAPASELPSAQPGNEPEAVVERYARRQANAGAAPDRYSLLQPDVWQTVQERQRVMLRLFSALNLHPLSRLRVAEVGCGAGGNLLELLRMGFSAERLAGAELLPERMAQARRVLPADVALWQGDASRWAVRPGSQHIVLQSTVFSSLLDRDFQQCLADAMWSWLMPGGGVLWYDFTVDNPRNPDVKGVPLKRLRELFPHARMRHRKLTLAPPIARAVCRIHPSLYPLFNALPALRTHVLAWLEKPAP